METPLTHIKELNIKLQHLLRRFGELSSENVQQKKIIAALTQKDRQQQEHIKVLQEQQLILKASLDTMDEKEKKELEQKINGYLRNIDKCISLLSYNQNV